MSILFVGEICPRKGIKLLLKSFSLIKREFPNAKAAFASCTDKVDMLTALIKQMGFVEDDSYVPNKELVPNPAGYIGYRKDL